jgi:hypothetical protein
MPALDKRQRNPYNARSAEHGRLGLSQVKAGVIRTPR